MTEAWKWKKASIYGNISGINTWQWLEKGRKRVRYGDINGNTIWQWPKERRLRYGNISGISTSQWPEKRMGIQRFLKPCWDAWWQASTEKKIMVWQAGTSKYCLCDKEISCHLPTHVLAALPFYTCRSFQSFVGDICGLSQAGDSSIGSLVIYTCLETVDSPWSPLWWHLLIPQSNSTTGAMPRHVFFVEQTFGILKTPQMLS